MLELTKHTKVVLEVPKEFLDSIFNELAQVREEIKSLRNTEKETSDEKEYVSKNTAAFLIDVSVPQISLYARTGKLKKHYLDGKNSVRFKREDVLNLLKEKKDNDNLEPGKQMRAKTSKRGMRA